MPNKNVELILMSNTKIFFKTITFFSKNSIESVKTGKVAQTPWENGSTKRHKKIEQNRTEQNRIYCFARK